MSLALWSLLIFSASMLLWKSTLTISCVNKPLGGSPLLSLPPLSLSLTLVLVIRLQGEMEGGGWVGGVWCGWDCGWRESCFIIQPYELRWSLTSLFATTCLNIIVVYDSYGAKHRRRLPLWSYDEKYKKQRFKGPSHYMQWKLVSGHQCVCGGGEINHLSMERLRQGTWLYKERGDWEHSLVSGSCMQTSSWEGGEKHSQSWVVCVVRLQRVQVYNGEEESKKETSNGRAAVQIAALSAWWNGRSVSWKDEVICHDSPIHLHRWNTGTGAK